MTLSLDQRALGGWGERVCVDECRIWFGRQKQHAIVMGLTDGKRCALRIIPNRKAATLLPVIADLVAPGSIVVTDGFVGYRRVNRLGFTHSKVIHARKMWVNEGGNSTSEIEGIWRWVRRLLMGRAGAVSEANLWKFLGEFMYRYEVRGDRAAGWWRLIGRFARIDEGVLERARRRIDLRYVAGSAVGVGAREAK
jgi:transposase-like protein